MRPISNVYFDVSELENFSFHRINMMILLSEVTPGSLSNSFIYFSEIMH